MEINFSILFLIIIQIFLNVNTAGRTFLIINFQPAFTLRTVIELDFILFALINDCVDLNSFGDVAFQDTQVPVTVHQKLLIIECFSHCVVMAYDVIAFFNVKFPYLVVKKDFPFPFLFIEFCSFDSAFRAFFGKRGQFHIFILVFKVTFNKQIIVKIAEK